METTLFYGLHQGDHDDNENGAELIAVFSSVERAEKFQELLSEAHTELKRVANEISGRIARGEKLLPVRIPDVYWDVRPVPFDPRQVSDLDYTE